MVPKLEEFFSQLEEKSWADFLGVFQLWPADKKNWQPLLALLGEEIFPLLAELFPQGEHPTRCCSNDSTMDECLTVVFPLIHPLPVVLTPSWERQYEPVRRTKHVF